MSKKVFLLLAILLPTLAYSQGWKRLKYEATGGIGVSNFLGDLGGADGAGSDFVKDMELTMTHFALQAGLRYRISRLTAAKATLTYGMLRGDDALTNNEHRNPRNLSFRSPIVELSTQFEYSFIKENDRYRFRMKGAKGANILQSVNAYAFAGLGFFWFNPKAQYLGTGKWYALQPLGTEGQGLEGGKSKYSRVSISIPLGVGFKYRIDHMWSAGFEIGVRKTFTDYIDDVSTVYYPSDSIAKYVSIEAAYFSNPGGKVVDEGYVNPDTGERRTAQRGDPSDNDSYMFIIFNVNKKLRKSKSFTPRLR
ncbi:MAG: outer membrane beta-barrel protein [Flavobacteriales bacterium]|nr:outer membrane beta-barrel protein [Flavobacteriales bacterium]